MKEIIYDYEEFKNRLDPTKTIHHNGIRENIDKQGLFYRLRFRIYALDKKDGHVLVFEAIKRTTLAEYENHRKDYESFVEKFAKPLGSTEGEWIP
ncbi:hypothetical protein DRO69_13090 [Candidatus Bathyarchaeota archaeon]|nr:MAG: hypothetical protein DRO69_13090 [Candidatus Bathyarchaeota archaeon]